MSELLGYLKRFLLIFIPSTLGVGIILAGHYQGERSHFYKLAEANEKMRVDKLVGDLTKDFESIVGDLKYLAGRIQPENNSVLDLKLKKSLEKDLLLFSYEKKMYDQIRFLDVTGRETIRIDYNHGNPVSILEKDLQDKSHRYYFKKASTIKRGGIYISPFDLNVERNQIQTPYTPMLRFCTPVFSKSGHRIGILVLNYFGRKILSHFDFVNKALPGNYMLLNTEGFWLKSKKSSQEWGFMFEERQHISFPNIYPEVWAAINTQESGQILIADGLFSFFTLSPIRTLLGGGTRNIEHPTRKLADAKQKDDLRYWKIVSHIPTPTLNSTSRHLLKNLLRIYLLLIGVIAFISMLFVKLNLKKRKIEAEKQNLMADVISKQEQIEKDLQAAAEIQFSLLPSAASCRNDLQMAWTYMPSHQVGGDFFNIHHMDEHRASFYMIDVCGHGMSAALVSVTIAQFLQARGCRKDNESGFLQPQQVLEHLNREFPFDRLDTYFTISYVMIDFDRNLLVYANGGHLPPLLIRENGNLINLANKNPAIGLIPSQNYVQDQINLLPGDRILLYTDGILENQNSYGSQFGRERFQNVIKEGKRLPVESFVKEIRREYTRFLDKTPPEDDISILVFEYKGDSTSDDMACIARLSESDAGMCNEERSLLDSANSSEL